jgi:hypothetical protein
MRPAFAGAGWCGNTSGPAASAETGAPARADVG